MFVYFLLCFVVVVVVLPFTNGFTFVRGSLISPFMDLSFVSYAIPDPMAKTFVFIGQISLSWILQFTFLDFGFHFIFGL